MIKGKKVNVTDDNIEKALRKFKKKVTDSGLLKDLQEKEHYVKPSVRRKVAKSLAVRRWKKYLRSLELPKKLF
jgi:small subunit ribosomal protein S21